MENEGKFILKEYKDVDLAAVRNIAQDLIRKLECGSVVALIGTLGSGKTTFAKMLIDAIIGKESNATSPTFNLVHNYESALGQIWHFDLYRLRNIEEAYQIGIEEAFINGISIIEWPELIENLLPKDTISLKFSFGSSENVRNIQLYESKS